MIAGAPTTRRTAGRPLASALAVSCLHPAGDRFVPASELGAELLSLVTPAARALGGADALARIDPAACEADLQLQSSSAVDAAADLVARTLG